MNFNSMILFFFLTGCVTKTNHTALSSKNQLELVSFCKGHTLWQEYLSHANESYRLEEVIEGLRSAERGDAFPIPEEQFFALAKKIEKENLEKRAQKNLLEAELFLNKLQKDSEAVELIPSKLYYILLQKGSGKEVTENDAPLLTYTTKILEADLEKNILSSNEPVCVNLLDAIPGFSRGVVGMLENEERTLYIHPDLAYGITGGFLEPNQLTIIDVKILALTEK